MFFFFSVRVVLSCQKASCREIRKETEELIEVSYRYCSCIQNFTIRTCTMRGSLIKSSQFQIRTHKGVSHETGMLKFKKKYFKLPNQLLKEHLKSEMRLSLLQNTGISFYYYNIIVP